MTPDVVVDVGNTRVKWGRCAPGAVTETASLPPDDAAAWEEQTRLWRLPPASLWVLAGVHPARRDRLARWLHERGERVRVVREPGELPLRVTLEHPEWAGIDRLLDAVAVNARRRAGRGAVVIDAGSAVTVDWVDEGGAFAGGAILPGFRLMARALHNDTALLPLIEPVPPPPPPGATTIAAMEAGVFWAVAGGVRALIGQYQRLVSRPVEIYLTGGDGALLHGVLDEAVLWPALTLEGLRLTAESLS